jgi:O-antigen/teichoic acid export membrane protein
MDGLSIVPSPPGRAWRAAIEPAIRHIGWFGFFLALAPIIGPRGYGLFAIALSGIAICDALLVQSIAATLIRVETLDERHLSTALLGGVGAGGALSLVLYAASVPLGTMLDDAPLGDIVQSLTLLPVLGALGAVPGALLRRRGKHGPLIAATTAGLLGGGGIALALASAGAGPWSLVAQIVVQRFVECLVLWGIAARRVGLAWSAPHVATLLGAINLRTLAPVWPIIARQSPALVIGLSLGPVAAGLYMLAARIAEAVHDILLTTPQLARRALLASWADDIGALMHRVALPAVLTSVLLPVALPPLVDLRWWGAVLPAQILVLGLIPAAIIAARAAALGSANEALWQAAQTLGGIAAIALAAPYGLISVADASLAFAAVAALGSVAPIRRELGLYWSRALACATRPLGAAALSGIVLHMIAEPISLALTPVGTLCLLGACGRLCYLLVGGEPRDAQGPKFAFRRWRGRATTA